LLTVAEEQAAVKLVFDERGSAKVTVPYCRKRLPFLRRVSEQTVRNVLHRAGLAWLRRRRKSAVPPAWKAKRIQYCKWLQTLPKRHLRRFAYTDGTTFYLARSPVDFDGKQRAGLGPGVWRMSSGKDGLWDANIGPSLYAKSQGLPVKIWGLFANGRLEYWVLPRDGQKTTNMNTETYCTLVNGKFKEWREMCFGDTRRCYLVQDHEKCLWADENLESLEDEGFDVVTNHPKYSPDLNAIEGWWARLRQRLDASAPEKIETRGMFIRRLRRTVTWMNDNLADDGRHLCTNQKERAAEILLLKGAKCKF